MKKNFFESLSKIIDENGEFYSSEFVLNGTRNDLTDLKKMGIVEKLSKGKWRIVDAKKSLKLTEQEFFIFNILKDMEFFNTEDSDARFVEKNLLDLFEGEKDAHLLSSWEDLKKKMLDSKIISYVGNGVKGIIFNINPNLLNNCSVVKTAECVTKKIGRAISLFNKELSNIEELKVTLEDFKKEEALLSGEIEKLVIKPADLSSSILEIQNIISSRDTIENRSKLLKSLREISKKDDSVITILKEIFSE